MSETVVCLPLGMCSWDYELEGFGVRCTLEINWGSEQGRIQCNGEFYEIVKHGPFSGYWTMERDGAVVCSAQKTSAFTRTFEISHPAGEATLKAESAMGRTMVLSGVGTEASIQPAHPFTRRATITGEWNELEHVAFAFWLTIINWRRAANNN